MHLSLFIFIMIAAIVLIVTSFGALIGESFSGGDSDGPSEVPRITAKAVEQLAYAGGTDAEIADRFMVEQKFLRWRFAGVLRTGRALRKLHIRSLQFDLAKKLNGPMLMWLGRNELAQSTNPANPGEAAPEVYEN